MRHARLSGCSFVYPGQTLDEGLRLAKSFGFCGVDAGIGGLHGHVSPREAASDPERYADQVRSAAAREDLVLDECFTLNFGPPVNDPAAATREETGRLFDGLACFASEAGFRSVMLLPGPIHPALGPQRSLDLAVEAFKPLVEVALLRGIPLHVEADCESCARTPAAAEELCTRVPGLRLTLDYSHYLMLGHTQQEIMPLNRYAGHVHVRQAAKGRIVETVRGGGLDFRLILRDLARLNYNGSFAIEYLACKEAEACGADIKAETRAMAEELEGLLTALDQVKAHQQGQGAAQARPLSV